MKWYNCTFDDGTPNGQSISDDFHFKSDGVILNPYVSTNNHIYYLFKYDYNKQKLVPIEYLIEKFIKKNDIDLNNIDIIYHDNGYEIITYEIWKPITLAKVKDNKYEISNMGNIRQISGKPVSIHAFINDKYNAGTLQLSDDYAINKSKKWMDMSIHRLVANEFIINPAPNQYNEINHIDGNGHNNHVWNLEWCDQDINSKHAALTGLMTDLDVILLDIIRDLLIKYNGSSRKVYDKIHDKYPYVTLRQIYAIKLNKGYMRSLKYSQYDLEKISKLKVDYSNYSTEIFDEIRDILLREDINGSPIKTCRLINDIHPELNIGIGMIKSIKGCRKGYTKSNKYKIDQFYKDMNKIKVPGKGSYKRMNAISTEQLDFIRNLAMLKPFNASPRTIYQAINHNKYPEITENIIKGCIYESNNYGPYMRSNIYDLEKFDNKIKSKILNDVDIDLINAFTISYSKGNPDITDEAFDVLLESYVSQHGEESRPFTRVKQSTAINNIVGTLVKTGGVIAPMRVGQKTYIQWKDLKKIPDNATIIVQPKFDGGSVAYDFETNVHATRGDFDDGTSVDVTELFDSPIRKDYYDLINKEENYKAASMKFECIMSHDIYVSQYADKYDRPRDAMAAILHSRNTELAKKHLSLMDLRIMLKDGTHRVFLETLNTICLTTKANDYVGIDNFIKEILDNGAMVFTKDHWYECDGVVVSVIDDYTGNILDEVAIKILNMVEETKLLNIEWQFGRTGRITPVAILEPVKFGNVTVTHATLSNPNRVVQLGLKYGDSCRIMYNIVPYFLTSKRDGDMIIEIPTTCPICGTPFDMSSLKVCQCPNPMCVGKLLGNVIGYCKDMRMKGVAEATINALWDEGVINSIDSLYKITADDIKNIKGFGETSANAIIKAIHDASLNVPLDKWLGALPFNNVNKRTWNSLINFIFQSPENFLDILDKARNPEEMIMQFYPVPGIGELTLLKIFEGFRLYWDTIKFVSTQIQFTSSNKQSTPKNGIKIGLSGTRDPKLIEYLENCGYEVMKYNNSCSILVIPNKDYTSDSVTKAMSKNKTIITVDEAYKL